LKKKNVNIGLIIGVYYVYKYIKYKNLIILLIIPNLFN